MSRRIFMETGFVMCWAIMVNVIAIGDPGFFIQDDVVFRDMALAADRPHRPAEGR